MTRSAIVAANLKRTSSEERRAAVILERKRAKILRSQDGSVCSRALFSIEGRGEVEFYELRLAPRGVERAEPHPPGTTENLVVTSGALELRVEGERLALVQGDAVQFDADVPHEYRNPGAIETVICLAMTYVGRSRP